MRLYTVVPIRSFEAGAHFVDGTFRAILKPGRYEFLNLGHLNEVHVFDMRELEAQHPQLDVMARAKAFKDRADVLELGDGEYALVWRNKRFAGVLRPGLHVVWKAVNEVRIEIVAPGAPLFEHDDLTNMLPLLQASMTPIGMAVVGDSAMGLVRQHGRLVKTVGPGVYAYWRDLGVNVELVDMREHAADVSGQELLTLDRVSLRLNATVLWAVDEPVTVSRLGSPAAQYVHREAQLALRAAVGTRDLESLLAEKNSLGTEALAIMAGALEGTGLKVRSFGVKDIILPGEIRQLMNQVTEARQAAEASIITRREELAAARAQSNTARIYETNPTLLRLRELETLEKIAEKTNLTVVLGEHGLTDRVTKLL